MMLEGRSQVILVPVESIHSTGPERYRVKRGENVIGMLERYSEAHPWKSYVRFAGKFIDLGAWYEDNYESAPDDTDFQRGGRDAALNAIISFK